MARTGFFHHIGTFLLFVAAILLLITTISSPVVNDLAILKVDLGNRATSYHSTVTFGTFGWCENNLNGDGVDNCSKKTLGYSPAAVMNQVENTQFSDYATRTTRSLTKAMILHPIACGLNFIAFMLALGAGVVGSLLASLVAAVAFIVTLVILIIDFVLFSIVKSNVNDDGTGAHAFYASAAWVILVSAICSLIGTIIVFLTCCSGRLHRRRDGMTKHEVVQDGYAPATTRRRRWF